MRHPKGAEAFELAQTDTAERMLTPGLVGVNLLPEAKKTLGKILGQRAVEGDEVGEPHDGPEGRRIMVVPKLQLLLLDERLADCKLGTGQDRRLKEHGLPRLTSSKT